MKQRRVKEEGLGETAACATVTWRREWDEAQCHRGTNIDESFSSILGLSVPY